MSDPYVNALNPQRINSCCHAMTFGTVAAIIRFENDQALGCLCTWFKERYPYQVRSGLAYILSAGKICCDGGPCC